MGINKPETLEKYRKNPKNKDRIKAIQKRYYSKPRSKLKDRERHLKRTYGISIEAFNSILENQNGLCAICLRPPSINKNNFSVDHNHTTNKIRGVLCYRCNVGLGYFKEDMILLEKAINYLKKYE